ncbi:PX-associated-domain-containing protein [Xylaria arbuscula]|nr:PX-associated-domain-containing protein [Xylaria arbuscula]
MTEPGALTAPQLHALLDILIHHETYAEVQSFQSPEAIEKYGWPFVDRGKDGGPAQPHDLSSSPLLQLLLTGLILGAPAERDLSTEFWPVKFKGIMRRFGEADLSDSYDKGTLGTRKRLATAASTVHEAVTRGLLSGVLCEHLPDLHGQYNRENAEDLAKSWRDCICHLVYGNLIDEIFDQLARTSDLELHSPALRGAVEYAILHIATFLHQVFVLSPEGPYLLKLIENIHRLVPYTMVGQTLRIGNAASMINGMSKLFLSKVSIGAISNWIGLTSNASDGMNLSEIISLVLDWDAAEFRKLVDKFKSDKVSISSEHMGAIDKHLAKDRLQRKAVQEKSIREQISIIIAIFDSTDKQLVESLTDRQHASCLEYYAAKLAIRDRERIVDVLCNSTPDLTTAIVLEALGALDPMIRVVHKNVDLRKHLNAIESFLTDFIKTTKSKAQENSADSSLLTVEDFVGLLQRNRHLLWAYLHDFCKGCPDLRDTWKNWMTDAIKRFRQPSKSGSNDEKSIVDIEPKLRDAFNELVDDERRAILERIDAHSIHLQKLEKLSEEKMQKIVDATQGSTHSNTGGLPGPGVFASRWQALLDDTIITPSKPNDPLRFGKDVKGIRAARKSDNPDSSDLQDTKMVTSEPDEKTSTVLPDVSIVIEALGPTFKRMVADLSRDGLPKAWNK